MYRVLDVLDGEGDEQTPGEDRGCSPRVTTSRPSGTKRIARLEANAADHINLTAGHVTRLNDLPRAFGER
ncbi:hypothetical protein [Streptomyces bauhiniae]